MRLLTVAIIACIVPSAVLASSLRGVQWERPCDFPCYRLDSGSCHCPMVTYEGPADELPNIPGLQNSVGFTFDPRTEQYYHPIFLYHYDMGQTFNDQFRVPDELSIRAHSGQHKVDEAFTFYSSHEYVHQCISWASAGVTVGVETLNLNAQWQHTKYQAEQVFQADLNDMTFGERSLELYDLSVWPGSPLAPQFQRSLDMLPDTYESDDDKARFARFFAGFGTHYVVRASFGGMVNWTSTYEKHLYERHEQSWVNDQISLSINIAKWKLGIDGKIGKNDTKYVNDEDFKKHSKQEVFSMGGSSDLDAIGDYKEWLATIKDAPVALPHTMGLVPLDDLVLDKGKRESLRSAIMDWGNGVLNP